MFDDVKFTLPQFDPRLGYTQFELQENLSPEMRFFPITIERANELDCYLDVRWARTHWARDGEDPYRHFPLAIAPILKDGEYGNVFSFLKKNWAVDCSPQMERELEAKRCALVSKLGECINVQVVAHGLRCNAIDIVEQSGWENAEHGLTKSTRTILRVPINVSLWEQVSSGNPFTIQI